MRVSLAIVAGCVTAATAFAAPGGWQITEGETTRELSKGALTIACEGDECAMIIQTAACAIGTKYPLLVNSSKVVGVINSRCQMILVAGSERLGLVLLSSRLIEMSMINETTVSIAFPPDKGGLEIVEIDMSGAADAMVQFHRGAQPELSKPVGKAI